MINLNKIQELTQTKLIEYDLRPIIARTMRACGATYDEIGQAIGVSRQLAKYYAEKEI